MIDMKLKLLFILLSFSLVCNAQWPGGCCTTQAATEKIAVLEISPLTFATQMTTQLGISSISDAQNIATVSGGMIQLVYGGHWFGSFGENIAAHSYCMFFEVSATGSFNFALEETQDPETITILSSGDTKSNIIIKKLE